MSVVRHAQSSFGVIQTSHFVLDRLWTDTCPVMLGMEDETPALLKSWAQISIDVNVKEILKFPQLLC